VGRLFSYKVTFTIIVFIILLLVFIFFTPNHIFLQTENLGALGKLTPDLGIIALGAGTLMISGEFDLSVGSIIPTSSFIFVKLLEWGFPLLIVLFLTLLTGAVMGTLNGLLVVKGNLPSFIATLGTMMFWRGILYVACRMMPIGIRAYLEPGTWLENMFTGSVGKGFPVQILWFIGFSIVLGMILHFHRFGNWIYVTGDNKTAARAMGINTDMVKTVCYIIVGVLCSFMSMIQALRLESFAATQGIGFELKAIASSVVGGTSLMGGIGSIPGIFLGTLTIQILENGLILMGAPVFGINAFIGVGIILFAILHVNVERIGLR
jgi:simple sugar transport system permease protein